MELTIKAIKQMRVLEKYKQLKSFVIFIKWNY